MSDAFFEPTEEQLAMFDLEEPWRKLWKGMPEFVQEDLSAWKSLTINFASYGDLLEFAELLGQKLTPNTRSVWFPPAEIGRYANKRYADER